MSSSTNCLTISDMGHSKTNICPVCRDEFNKVSCDVQDCGKNNGNCKHQRVDQNKMCPDCEREAQALEQWTKDEIDGAEPPKKCFYCGKPLTECKVH